MFRKVNNLLNRKGQANSNGNRNGMDAKVSQLESMGFDKTQATNALEASNGNLQEATNFLLTNQEATTSLGPAATNANASNNSNNNNNTNSNARTTALNAAGKAAANRAKTAASRFGTNGTSKPKQTKKNNISNSSSRPIGNDNYINNLNATPSKKIAAIKAHHPKVKVPTKMGDKSKEEQILRCSKRLAPHPLAVDTLLQAFMHVRDYPSNDKYRKIDTHSQGYINVLKDKPGALDFLKVMNFTERNASGDTIGKDLVLTRDRVDPALLYLGISALEQIRKTEEYIYEKRLIQFRRDVTQIMDGSNLNANADQEEELVKRAHNISLVPSEPSNGAGALLQVNFGPSQSEVDYDGTGPGSANPSATANAMAATGTFEKVQKISRRFDGDDTLQDVIRWIGAHGSIIPSKMESREWCLVDLNKYPIEAIDVNRDMGKTVQYIGCWPSGKLEIRPSTSQWRQELEAKS